MTDVQLLDKTEVWLYGITLDDADLPALARVAAEVLGIAPELVFVTDVRENLLVLDILSPRVSLEDVAGKQTELLEWIGALAGVTIADTATVHSEGILGVIGTPRAQVDGYLAGAAQINRQISDYAARRVAIVSTGREIVEGHVHDTNFEAAKELLSAIGLEVEYGGVAGDSEREIAGMVARLSGEGYGLIVTTGGVGAEDKDRTIEALELLDPALSTAILAQYQKGHGRHVKDCVRIAVGKLGWSRIVALPGPTHEVKLALAVLAARLADDDDPATLAEAMAVPLRATLPQKHAH